MTRHTERQNTVGRDGISIRTRLDTAGMLELSNKEFKTTMINKLRVLINKVDSM